ncbi:MAG: TraB/GumN family protein [Deltaproteobacteria bacterium]|jgi:uncharacterized protein YbaP (TraB family)|nr:TraB/GumN family protein [Deltaproteobacteria bacterium]
MRLSKWITSLRLILASFVILLATCQGLQAEENFLWSVESPGRDSQLYILGSIHMAREQDYPLNPIIEKAFDDSSFIVVEMDVTATHIIETIEMMTKKGRLEDKVTLWDLLDDETARGLERCLAKISIPKVVFSNFKPWMASITLASLMLHSLGLDGELGVDVHFIKKAKAKNLRIYELETVQEQLGILADMDDNLSIKLLKASILEFETKGEEVQAMMDIWRRGDVEAFEELYFRVYIEHPDLAELLNKTIFERNQTMFERLKGHFFPGKKGFVLIGAAHMVGQDSILAKFKEAGFLVTKY